MPRRLDTVESHEEKKYFETCEKKGHMKQIWILILGDEKSVVRKRLYKRIQP